ncbi:hypothetical protein ZYGM_003861 [Zygosaccharomyces mellis]|uniref:Ubiquitin-like domain-containing protein n=1 Tax=Zygosaccharomyces mellis TaxID=42258 RepID=A0A4C2E1E0_9SACH|nr:hypothetical protein ZYGM_003861 [Zygosaccharomyces mellis]
MNQPMAECLALSPLKFSIWSTDWSLIRTNLFVNAHPKASVARLLQYVHWQIWLQRRSTNNHDQEVVLGCVSDYTFYQGHEELNLELLLQDIEPDSKGFIKLQLEKRRIHSSLTVNLAYDMENEFEGLNLNLNVNALSVKTTVSRLEYVSMGATIGRLKKLAFNMLTNSDMVTNNESTFKLEDGNKVQDLLRLSAKGRKESVLLDNERMSELYEDVTVAEFLGIDFAPQNNSFFNLILTIGHDQKYLNAEENVTIEFVSDSKLSMNQMVVTPNTTVEQVKEFICSVYTHALRLSPSDVKLIYKGQLIHRLDLAGNPSKIMDYVKEPQGTKLHVYINQEYNEPGPGFWNELFNNPARFDFMNVRSQRQQAQQHQQRGQHNAYYSPQLQESTNHTSRSSVFPDQTTVSFASGATPTSTSYEYTEPSTLQSMSRSKYVTESGMPIERGNETFTHCNINGEQVWIPSERLNSFHAKLEVNDRVFPVTPQDFVISNGIVSISPQLIQQIESSLQTRLTNNEIPTSRPTDDSPQEFNTRETRERLVSWTRVFSGLLLLAKSLYLVANNSVIPFFFVLELSTILPRKYTMVIATFILLRTIWSTREVWDMWTSFFNLNSIDESTYHEVKEHIIDKRLTRFFYKDCESHSVVIEIFMASNLREERQQLQQNYTIEEFNEQHGAQAWHHFLKGVGQDIIRKEPLDRFLISCLTIYEDSRAVMPHSYQESWKQLLKLAQKDVERITSPQSLPLHRRIFRALQWQIERIRQSQPTMTMLEQIIPNPTQDNIISAIVKNIILFILIFLPPFKHRVDAILDERKRLREQQRRTQEEEERSATASIANTNRDDEDQEGPRG